MNAGPPASRPFPARFEQTHRAAPQYRRIHESGTEVAEPRCITSAGHHNACSIGGVHTKYELHAIQQANLAGKSKARTLVAKATSGQRPTWRLAANKINQSKKHVRRLTGCTLCTSHGGYCKSSAKHRVINSVHFAALQIMRTTQANCSRALQATAHWAQILAVPFHWQCTDSTCQVCDCLGLFNEHIFEINAYKSRITNTPYCQ